MPLVAHVPHGDGPMRRCHTSWAAWMLWHMQRGASLASYRSCVVGFTRALWSQEQACSLKACLVRHPLFVARTVW